MIHALREKQGWLTYCGLSIEKRRGEDFKTVAGELGFNSAPAELGPKCKSCAEAIRIARAVARWRAAVAVRAGGPPPRWSHQAAAGRKLPGREDPR